MQLETSFEVSREPAEVERLLNRDETLLGLFPGESEIVSRVEQSAIEQSAIEACGWLLRLAVATSGSMVSSLVWRRRRWNGSSKMCLTGCGGKLEMHF